MNKAEKIQSLESQIAEIESNDALEPETKESKIEYLELRIQWTRDDEDGLTYLEGWEQGIKPRVRNFIELDDGLEGVLHPSDWDKAEFRVPVLDMMVAVNVTITSRKIRYAPTHEARVRCQVEFVGDCEESEFARGWLYLRDDRVLKTDWDYSKMSSEDGVLRRTA